MTRKTFVGLLCLAAAGMAQDVQFDYDRSANFAAYRTYSWAEVSSGRAANQLMDQNIRRVVDSELALKGLRSVPSGGDIRVTYQVAVDQEKQFDGLPTGPRWFGAQRVTTSTIEIGKLVVNLFDPATNQLVWRGSAAKTLDIRKDPDKNYANLQKAVAKLFKYYPPGSGKK